ncbi:MAG: carbohydrate kinase family protein [Anaerolineae bacterium]|nr:carbohydrate kinase family protein [Anaerolineae bacterium]
MRQAHTAVVAGHLCLDVIPTLEVGTEKKSFSTMFRPSSLTVIGPVILSTGGPVSNTGLALHKLGIVTQLMGKIGDDPFGQIVLRLIAAYDPRLTQGMVVDPSVSTSYTIVISPPDVDRFFLHYPGANDTFSAADVRYDVVSQASLFHFGYPPIMRLMYIDNGVQLTEIFRRAKETGVTTSLDMAVPDPTSEAGRVDWRRILQATIPFVDVFLPSVEEMLFMMRRGTYEELSQKVGHGGDILPLITPELLSDLSQELLDWGGKIIGFKLGYRGFYVRTADQATLATLGHACPSNLSAWANQEMWTACFRVQVVGTAGSGDSTIAGFLAALLRDMELVDAVTAAVAVGACNVEAADTLSGVRSWEETWQRITSGWAHHDLHLDTPGWEFDADHHLWRRAH